MEINFHGTEEQLELYALGQLSDSESAVIEDHLLLCDSCRQRLDQTEEFVVSMREALKLDPPPAGVSRAGAGWLAWLRRPVFALAGTAVVLAAIGLAFVFTRTAIAPVASLQLTALRGEMPSAPRAGELDLTLADAPQDGRPFRLEVVDAAGRQIWMGTGTEAQVHRPLDAGVYFVRLYANSGQLIREYGFTVK